MTRARPLPGAALRVGALYLALTVAAAACTHDWDALDPPSDDPQDVCTDYCEVYGRCAAAAPSDCVQQCEADLADCATQSRADLQACVADLDASCGSTDGLIQFEICSGLIVCWDS